MENKLLKFVLVSFFVGAFLYVIHKCFNLAVQNKFLLAEVLDLRGVKRGVVAGFAQV